MEIEQLKYPIGKYKHPDFVTASMRHDWINRIAALPQKLEAVVQSKTEAQLDTPYRPGGWTVRQVVHHLADSHLNAHCRIRLALTEDHPTIKPYDQDKWAVLEDVKKLPVWPSLHILQGLHARWAFLLNSLDELHFQREFVHPEYGKTYTIDWMTGLYAWHGEHHLAQIANLKE
ncbi:MAG: putative metal-dependent hydrolase [Lewinellaceae bacterium]|nr:putative metal-dependent hydrolase [Saprospiraceae bacterium]MCB9340673.1 putative metal-dependent hydrolase [Lewinellaceae bacterium]